MHLLCNTIYFNTSSSLRSLYIDIYIFYFSFQGAKAFSKEASEETYNIHAESAIIAMLINIEEISVNLVV